MIMIIIIFIIIYLFIFPFFISDHKSPVFNYKHKCKHCYK